MSEWKILGQLSAVKPEDRISEIISIILKNRGIKSNNDFNKFFKPTNPLDVNFVDLGISKTQMELAIVRIIKAIDRKQSIVIYGDYDCDGITSCAILWETLYKYNKKVMPYIPNRIDEGYGLSVKGIDKVIKEFKPDLIITVDHGITARNEIEYAKSKNIDVIVTDHHTIPQKKPRPFALIHSTNISGSSVSWFLAKEIESKLSPGKFERELEEKLSLCAIGTITDLLPLKGINRSIVNYGLNKLRETERLGLLEIFSLANILKNEIDSYHVAFFVGPRINSTGRLTSAMDSLRLLCTKSTSQARKLASDIEITNRKRQQITLDGYNLVKQIIKPLLSDKLIFIESPDLNLGIIGLIAGKIVDEYYKPAIVISVGKFVSKASARSIEGFDIISAIRDASEFLIDCGGHPLAAGFTIETNKIDSFKKKISAVIKKQLNDNLLIKPVVADCQLQMSDLSIHLHKELLLMKPYGFGNKEPVFLTDNLEVVQARVVGNKNNHLKLRLKQPDSDIFEAIAFNKAQYYQKISKTRSLKMIYSLMMNKFYNNRLELKIKELKEMS